MWVSAGRAEEAMAVADDAVAATRAHGSPWLIAHALYAAGHTIMSSRLFMLGQV